MKIGILLKNLNALANWELRIIEEIMKAEKLKISLLLLDDSISHRFSGKTLTTYSPKKIISTFLFRMLWFVERKVVIKESDTVDKQYIIDYLRKVPRVEITSSNEDSSDLRNQSNSEAIRAYDLDVIVSLGFSQIKEEILKYSKNGVWRLHHGADHIHKENPIGFQEIMAEDASVMVSLNKLGPESNEKIRIDKAYFNRHWSLVKTREEVLESSVSVLLKNLKKLERGKLSVSNLPTKKINRPKKLKTFQILTYKIRFYRQLTQKLIERTFTKLLGTRYYCFTLFSGEGDFLNTDRSVLNPIKLPKNELWADPFLFRFENEIYVFFESCPYTTKRGKISCGKLKNGKISEVQDILDLDYHLSYPYIFEENGDIYLMPESSENKNLTIYKCLEFPHKWEPFVTAFEGEYVADAFFHNDEWGQKWLFLNKSSAASVPLQNELHIYKVDSLKLLNQSVPHKQNPVIIDTRTARNGGAIFKHNNEIYRPSQCNDEGIYGRALNINKIKKLTLDEYIEEIVETIEPDFEEGLLATHHLHQIDGFFIVDAAYKKL